MIEAGDNSSPLQLHRVSQAEIDLAAEILAGLDWHPTFALIIVIDAGEPAVGRARASLQSLARQGYGQWRALIIVRERDIGLDAAAERLAAGTDTVAALRRNLLARPKNLDNLRRRLLEGLTEIDERVVITARGGLDRLSDIARAHCPGGGPLLVTLLRAGDELGGDALSELAITAGLDRAADFFYSDEQRPRPGSNAMAPFLKPNWSPDLLLSTNYIGRLWCATPVLLDRCDARLSELLRCGEYDLVLRCTEAARAIRHVPRVLCRRTAGPLDAAPSERRALKRAIARRGITAEVLAGPAPGIYRVKRQVIDDKLVSIIIPTQAARGLIETCISTIRQRTAYRNIEIVVVDDIPPAEARWKTWIRAHADKVLPAPAGAFNWSLYNNTAARAASGDYLLFLNDDVEVLAPGWLHALVEHAQHSEVGIVGARLLYPDGTIQHAGMFLAGLPTARHAFRHKRRGQLGYFGLALTQRNVTAVTGACLMTRRDVFERVGGFDERHDVINNDLDYCLKVQALGLRCVYTPYAVLRHHERATRGDAPDRHDGAAFDSNWRSTFAAGDPYHHPNLSQHVDDLAPDREELQTICAPRPLLRHGAIQRILILKLDHLGDCIGAIPAVRRLKQHFPQAHLSVLTGEWALPIWRQVPEIDETIPFSLFHAASAKPPRRVLSTELQALAAQLAPYRFDLAVDFRGHPESRDLVRYTGAAFTAGFQYRGRFPWLDVAPEWGIDEAGVAKHRHFGDSLIGLVDAVATACQREPDLLPAEQEPELLPACIPAALFTRRVVSVHVGGDAMRRWPAGHFAELIDLLIDRDDVNVALIGGSGDAAAVAAVMDGLRRPERVVSLAGLLDLAELPGFLRMCALFVGSNSGPKHIAAGIGVPVVAAHSGQVDAREWGPAGPRAIAMWRKTRCAPCYLSRPEECDRGLACLVELRPRDIYPLCRRLLAIGYGRRRGTIEDLDLSP